MSYEIFVEVNVGSKLKDLNKEDKKSFTTAIDLMQTEGQLGEPINREWRIWKYRSGNVRIVYQVLDDRITVMDLLVGLETKDQ